MTSGENRIEKIIKQGCLNSVVSSNTVIVYIIDDGRISDFLRDLMYWTGFGKQNLV